MIAHDIGRVCARRTHYEATNHPVGGYELQDVDQVPHRLGDELLFAHRPDLVPKGAEVFDHERCQVVARPHGWAPILRLVEPAEEDVAVVDIEPGVWRDLALFQHDVDRDDVTECEGVGGCQDFGRGSRVHDLCQKR